MGSSSSKSKKSKTDLSRVTEVDRQVLGLKTQRRKLNAYGARVAECIETETKNAMLFAKQSHKQKALHALRKRKLLEMNLGKINQWLLSVETLLGSIEQAQATSVVLERLKQGNAALKTAQKGYGVDEVFEVLREMEEGAEKESEINQILGERLDSEADDAALAELEALEAEEVKGAPVKETEVPVKEPVKGVKVPSVPVKVVPAEDVAAVAETMPAAPVSLPSVPSAGEEKEEEKEERKLVPAS